MSMNRICAVLRTNFLPTLSGACRCIWLACLFGANSLSATEEPQVLQSWNAGASREAIIQFVDNATNPKSGAFVVPRNRIAVFDHDGTLWAEQPLVQLKFAEWRLHRMAKLAPAWRDEPPFNIILREGLSEHDQDWADILEVLRLTHSQLSKAEFQQEKV